MKGVSRNSSMELLRIISIIFIIAFHACMNGNVFQQSFSMNSVFVSVLGIWGLFGVNIFFIITAWFMLDEAYIFKVQRIIKLVETTMVITLFTVAIAAINGKDIGVADIIKAILSPALNTYWFLTAYLLLWIIFPILRKIINSLSNKQLNYITTVSIIIVIFYKSVFSQAPIAEFDLAILVVFVTAVVKRNFSVFKKYAKKSFSILTIVIILSSILMCKMSLGDGIVYNVLINRFSVFMLLDAVFLFVIISEKNIKNKFINKISGYTFGIYVFHCSPFIAAYIWNDIFEIGSKFQDSLWIVRLLIGVLSVFIIALMVSVVQKIICMPITYRGSWMNKINTFINEL